MAIKEEFKNFDHILRHKIDRYGLTFITISSTADYEYINLELNRLKPFILQDSRTIVTTTRKLDMDIVRYCYENNLRVETISLYSSENGRNNYGRLPRKINKCIVIGNRDNRVTESIYKFYSNFTKVYKFKV